MPAYLYRNNISSPNRSVRFRLEGRKSNRDGIGAVVCVHDASGAQTQMVKSGSSYLSSSDLALTLGVGARDAIDLVTISCPSGRTDEFRKLATSATYRCVEGETPERLNHR